ACFGQFLIMKDMVISYKQLPLPLYELTRYSFRAEQRGEVAGLRRLRAFTMPDCHALVSDIEMAKEELMVRFDVAWGILEDCGLSMPDDFEVGMRVTQDFWNAHKDFVVAYAKRWGKPILVEMWSEQFFYFVQKYEWNFVDGNDKAAALTTDQIDTENAERGKGVSPLHRRDRQERDRRRHPGRPGSAEEGADGNGGGRPPPPHRQRDEGPSVPTPRGTGVPVRAPDLPRVTSVLGSRI